MRFMNPLVGNKAELILIQYVDADFLSRIKILTSNQKWRY